MRWVRKVQAEHDKLQQAVKTGNAKPEAAMALKVLGWVLKTHEDLPSSCLEGSTAPPTAKPRPAPKPSQKAATA